MPALTFSPLRLSAPCQTTLYLLGMSIQHMAAKHKDLAFINVDKQYVHLPETFLASLNLLTSTPISLDH